MATTEMAVGSKADTDLSLYHLYEPEVLANPYPLYHRLRSEDPVHWDPFLHTWVVTRYKDVITVLHDFSANRTPRPGAARIHWPCRADTHRQGHGQADALSRSA